MPESSMMANMAKGETATNISHSRVLPFLLTTADMIGLQANHVKEEYSISGHLLIYISKDTTDGSTK
jgi:hypothetical protein